MAKNTNNKNDEVDISINHQPNKEVKATVIRNAETEPVNPAQAQTQPTPTPEQNDGYQPILPITKKYAPPKSYFNSDEMVALKALEQAPEDKDTHTFEDQNEQQVVNKSEASYKERKKVFKYVLSALIVIILAVGGFVVYIKFFKPTTGFSTYTMTNQGTTFSFKFIRNASVLHTEGYESLNAIDTTNEVSILVLPFDSTINKDCATAYNTLLVPFKVTVQGVSYSVCENGPGSIYFSDFEENNKWYEIDVYSFNSISKVNSQTVETIISSIQIK